MSGWRRFATVVAAVGVAVFVVSAMRAETRFMPTDQGIDAWHYTRMASGFPDSMVGSPFRNRPVVPLVVEVLPVPVTWGFVAVTSLLLGVTAAALDRVLRRWFSPRVAWVGLAMLASVGVVSGLVAQPFYVDAAVLAAAAVTLWLLAEQRWVALAVVLPVAVAAHELALLLLIPVVLTAWRAKKLPDAALVTVVSVGVWWFLHRSGLLVPVNERDNLTDAAHRAEMVRWNVAKYGTYPGAVWAHLVVGVGVLGLLAPFGVRRAPQLVRDSLWMLVPVAVLTLTASDWSRLLVPVLPALVAAACAAIVGSTADHAEPTPAEPLPPPGTGNDVVADGVPAG